ncbi:hypothetical protein [Nostoc sp. MS1]|uniref:hypothetical protein n=1 Tax=Nostoc sp. MS1 TaxID=2764711 RepID=UPI001CC620AD|nr:hypothetical protein [Nostoc sp. MS1]BCL33749.1 hypothetical protein NSMS1_01960 [Nostoc sp. MS1]
MKTENLPTSQNTESSTQNKSKEELNQETATEFGLGIALGVITIFLVAATAYFGLIS